MKRFLRRFAALATAAVTAFACAAAFRKQPADDCSSGFMTAEAAERFFPVSSDFTVRRAARYASLTDGSRIQAALKGRLGYEVTDSSGLYRDYRIIYTEPCENAISYSENAVFLYDPARRPELDAVSDQKLTEWMVPFLQFLNTEREITGVSQQYFVTVLDAIESGGKFDTVRGEPVIDSNWSYSVAGVNSLGNYETDELTDSITAFDVPYMAWGMLHEASHAYVDEKKSPFVTSDEVFANVRLLCTVRTLNRIGMTFPDVLRQDVRGRLQSDRAVYISSTAFQYACRDMRAERMNRFLALTNTKNGKGKDMFFTRLGMVFELGTNLSPWNPDILSDRAFADQLENDGYFDECWLRLYALCISDPDQISLSRVPFMIKPKDMYENYIIRQYFNYDYAKKHPKTVRLGVPGGYSPAEQCATLNVAYAIERRYSYKSENGQRVWHCTLGTLHAFNTYDFLFNEQNPGAFHEKLDSAAAGNRRITLFDVADGIAAG